MTDATIARDTALAVVEAHASSDWLGHAAGVIRALAATGAPFCTDECWVALDGHVPREPRAMGAVIRKMAAAGVIEATGEYRQSVRVECHCRPCAVWRGTAEYVDSQRPTPTTLF